MRLKIVLVAFALVVALGFDAAEAQFADQSGAPDPVPPPPGVELGGQDAGNASNPSCQKMCAADFSPCDPIYFKTEDGRCDGDDLIR